MKNYERYWRANRSMEQRILDMFAEETNTSPRTGDGSQRGSAHDPMRAVDRRIAYCEEHSEEYRRNLTVMRQVDAAIAALPDPLEREVLRLRYTDFRYGQQMTWPQVVNILYPGKKPDKKTVYAIHDDGVAHFVNLSTKMD